MKKRRCKICSYWQGNGKYRTNEKAIFEHKIREGLSLRELSKYLEYSVQLKVTHNTIRNHVKNCLSKDIQLQRQANITTQKSNNSIKKRVKRIFSIQPETPRLACRHCNTITWFDSGKIWIKCVDCGKLLGSYDPEVKYRNSREKTLILLEAFDLEK